MPQTTTPGRIPKPATRKDRKRLRANDIKLIDPIMENGVEMFRVRLPDGYRVVGRSESASTHAWYFVNASNLAVAKVVGEADGPLTTVCFDKPPKGFDAGEPPVASMSGGLSSRPEVGIFFENFGCVMRGFLRQERVMERERFEALRELYPYVREWAIKFDEEHRDRVERRGSMLSDIEDHMRCSRLALDVPSGEEEDSTVFDEPTVRHWILGHASSERGELARSVYGRYLNELRKVSPEMAAEMEKAYKTDQTVEVGSSERV